MQRCTQRYDQSLPAAPLCLRTKQKNRGGATVSVSAKPAAPGREGNNICHRVIMREHEDLGLNNNRENGVEYGGFKTVSLSRYMPVVVFFLIRYPITFISDYVVTQVYMGSSGCLMINVSPRPYTYNPFISIYICGTHLLTCILFSLHTIPLAINLC